VPPAAVGAGWDPSAQELAEYATVRAAGIDRDGTARLLYASHDPSDEESPLSYRRVDRPHGGSWPPSTAWSPPFPEPVRILDGPEGVQLASGLGPIGAAGPLARIALSPGEDPPDMAINDAGDAVVAWVRRDGTGLGRLLEATTHRAGRGWSAPARLSGRKSRISGFAVAIDPQGTAIAIWSEGGQPLGGKRQNPLRGQRIRVAERAVGARSWTLAEELVRGEIGSPYIGVDGAGTALAAWDLNPVVTSVRPHGGRWRRAGAVPATSCCIERLAVSPLGDAFLVGADAAGRAEGVWRRAAGAGGWERAPEAVAPSVSNALFPYRLAVNAAGDALLTWDDFRSNSSAPIGAAVYEAAPRPEIQSFRALRAGVPAADRLRFVLELSSGGRVLVTVRRPGEVRPRAAFMVTAGARRVRARIPPRALAALDRGRYVVEADTGARDPARAVRRATVIVTG
jgi:hypothetical protein